MQDLVVVSLTFEEISNINVECVKGTGVQNIGQDHQVKVPAKSVHQEGALYKVWWLKLRTWKGDVKGVKVNGVRNIGQGHRVKLPAESVIEEKLYAWFGGCRP